MDGELLRLLYHRLFSDSKLSHTAGCTFGDAVILLIHFHAVLTNHSRRWAHDKRNWPLWCRRLAFPSYSQLMKRLALPSTQRRIGQLGVEFRARLPQSGEKVCDAKPLVVGGYSKDRDAAAGKIPNGWARGYRLHLVVDSCGAVDAFDVTGLDAGEPTVMRRIVARLDLCGVSLRGDSNYDSNRLYPVVAARGGRLVAPRKKPGTGLGHHPHHPHRLLAIAELEGDPARLKQHKLQRVRIEQSLAHLTNLPFGLWALPNFVRGRRNVHRWITAKLALYHLYLALSRSTRAAA